MSTYAYVKLFVYGKDKSIRKSIDVNVNYMKSVLFGSDWPDELEGYSPEIDVDAAIDKIGYIKKSLLEEDEYVKKHLIKDNVFDEMFDTHKYVDNGGIKNKLDDTDILANEWVEIKRKNCNYNIIWITEGILSSYVDKIKQQISTMFNSFNRKESIENSIEYYKLNDDQKQELNDDIFLVKDNIDEAFDKLQACYQLIGLMDGFKEANEKSWEDEVVAALLLC